MMSFKCFYSVQCNFSYKIYRISRYSQCYRLNSSFRPFTLDDDLSIEVKKSIENKWSSKVYGVNPESFQDHAKNNVGGDQKMILSMFPYPSGRLHLGHVRVYTLSDVLARYNRMKGHKVIHPMGWDSFGLPAENAARDQGIEAEKWTRDNIQFMKEQIIRMGCCFDWDREISTCDPAYFKWTQWIFLKLWEKNLVYKKKASVFWDPIDQTVLAEEQVDSEGKSWRSGAQVEKKLLSQWFVKTTAFVSDLIEEMKSESLKIGWRDIIDIQQQWIGEIAGYSFDQKIELVDPCTKKKSGETLRIWFTSIEALNSAQHVIIRPDHFLATSQLNQNLKSINNTYKHIGFTITNPVNGKKLPIIVFESEDSSPIVPESSDCRLDEILNGDLYPPHLIKNESSILLLKKSTESNVEDNHLVLDLDCNEIKKASLKLRDWLVSRQRKWGTPIPIVNCVDCGHDFPVSYEKLPITQNSTLNSTTCPKCSSLNVKYESDTLDTFFDSSWYYLRYLDPQNNESIFDSKKVNPYLPVCNYVGGKEHATLHLFYARIMSHFFNQLGLIDVKETFAKLIPVGVVVGETFVTKDGKYLRKDQIEQCEDSTFKDKSTLEIIPKTWEKMSKSKYNGVEPELVIDEFGIDTMRFLCMAEVAPTSYRKWPTDQFPALMKFQTKIWTVLRDFIQVKEEESDIHFIDDEEWKATEDKLFDSRNYYLKGVNFNYATTSQISVAINKLQTLTSDLKRIPKPMIRDSIQYERALGALIICLYPVMPAICSELWQHFRGGANLTENEFNLDGEVWTQKWPELDKNYKLDLNIFIKGKEYCVIKVDQDILNTMDLNLALEYTYEHENVIDFIPRESLQVFSYTVEPGYRATLNLKKLTTKPIPKKKKKPKNTDDGNQEQENEVKVKKESKSS